MVDIYTYLYIFTIRKDLCINLTLVIYLLFSPKINEQDKVTFYQLEVIIHQMYIQITRLQSSRSDLTWRDLAYIITAFLSLILCVIYIEQVSWKKI